MAGLVQIGVLPAPAELPEPLVELRFSEGEGESTDNEGSLGGTAFLAYESEWPAFTTSVPSGAFAPSSNTSAIDLGPVAAGQGGRAVDLIPDGDDPTLGFLEAFTICGWVNARQLNIGSGGNRIAFALESPAGPGFDLVQLGNGALRLGVNDWPDGASNGPASEAGKITADPDAGPGNWVFFAVTYDSAVGEGEVSYYFGSGSALATLSSAHAYPQGPVFASGALTVGNFSEVVGARYETGDGGSRVFRGVIDELRVFDTALSPAQIQEAQINGALPPQPVVISVPPADRTTYENAEVAFTVTHSGTAPFTYQWQRDGADIPSATSSTYTLSPAVLADNGAKFRVKIGNAVSPEVISEEATLTVVADTGARVSLSFSESNTFVTNYGSLGGAGTYAATHGFPVLSTKVPAGPQTPVNNLSSVDFGTIAEGQGSRAIDFTNPFDDTLGPMRAFTVTGWLNCADLITGGGGNRIAFALASPAGPGLDLVQLVDGSLRLGVNDWPDGASNGPASNPGIITDDPDTGVNNWVYFAVTYDSTLEADQVAYYFGSPTAEAEPDLTATYDRGAIETSGLLTVGNFGSVVGARTASGPTSSRVFRGLLDELNIFSRALTLEEIQAQQKAAASQPATQTPVSIVASPQNVIVLEGGDAVFSVNAEGTPPLTYQWWRRQNGADAAIPGATDPIYTLSTTPSSASGDEFWVVVSNPVNSVTSSRATLTVASDDELKVQFSFSEGTGTTTANTGGLGGAGTLVVVNGYPMFSAQAPLGAFTPQPNVGSIDFGTIADGEGGRAINLEGGLFGAQAGPMTAFTLTGWLNCRDLQAGPGGNRLICAHNFSTDPGFDLVQNADGTLQLGVNSWPDFPTFGPASSAVVMEDPEAGAENWLFFAVTYDGEADFENVAFYFGGPDTAAEPDMVLDYPQGSFALTGALTVGNLNTADGARLATGGASRNFRGLLDELQVVNRVLSLEEIRAQQRGGGAPVEPITASLQIVRDGANIVLSWSSAESLRLQTSATLLPTSWADVPTAPVVVGESHTVTLPAPPDKAFYRLVK